jgi:hypothetical protein
MCRSRYAGWCDYAYRPMPHPPPRVFHHRSPRPTDVDNSPNTREPAGGDPRERASTSEPAGGDPMWGRG